MKYLLTVLSLCVGVQAIAGQAATKAAGVAAGVATGGTYTVMKNIAYGDLSPDCRDFAVGLGQTGPVTATAIAYSYKDEKECKESLPSWKGMCFCEYYFRLVNQ